MNLPTSFDAVTGEILDNDAVAIGELYYRSNSSLVEAVNRPAGTHARKGPSDAAAPANTIVKDMGTASATAGDCIPMSFAQQLTSQHWGLEQKRHTETFRELREQKTEYRNCRN